MIAAEATKTRESTYSVNDAIDILLEKLDEGIDDLENGRIQSTEEAWEDIDQIQGFLRMSDKYTVVLTKSANMTLPIKNGTSLRSLSIVSMLNPSQQV